MNLNESNLTVPDEDGTVERKGEAPLGTEFAPTEEFGGHDPLAGAVVGKRMNGGFILIAAVILSAVAGLFSMRKLAQVTAAAGIDTQVEATIEGFLDKLAGTPGDPTGAHDPAGNEHEKRVLAVITESYTDRQVPLEDVKRDPFQFDGEPSDRPGTTTLTPEEQAAQSEREREEEQERASDRIEAAARGLALKSIVGGSTKMALIGNSIVRMGETVSNAAGDITFRVTDITTSSVDLVSDDTELDLTVRVTIYLDR